MDVVCGVSTRLCDLVDVGDRAGDGDGAVPDQHEGGDDNDRQSEASEASEASEGWDLDPSLIAAALDDNNDDGVNAAQVPGAGKDGDEDKSGGSNTKGVRKVVSFDEYEFDDDAFEDAAFLAALEAASAASFLPAAVADLWALDTPTPTDSRDAASSPDLFENDTQTVPDAAFLWHDTDTDADSDGTDAEPDADDYFAYLTQRFQQQQQPRHAADPTDSQSTALSQSTLLSQPLSQPLSQICMPTQAKVMGRDALAQMLTHCCGLCVAHPSVPADPTADQVAALLDGLSLADFQDDLDDADDTEQSHVSHGQPPDPDDDDTDDEAEWSKYDNVDSVLEMIGLRINRLNVSSHEPA
ncbi:hypothetical protein BC831DRAFT_481338 [Entophlyctis helioformis]|nr:hypothetical protein BC831DRAFT_481338 [Entophlyctis helioformis]